MATARVRVASAGVGVDARASGGEGLLLADMAAPVGDTVDVARRDAVGKMLEVEVRVDWRSSDGVAVRAGAVGVSVGIAAEAQCSAEGEERGGEGVAVGRRGVPLCVLVAPEKGEGVLPVARLGVTAAVRVEAALGEGVAGAGEPVPWPEAVGAAEGVPAGTVTVAEEEGVEASCRLVGLCVGVERPGEAVASAGGEGVLPLRRELVGDARDVSVSPRPRPGESVGPKGVEVESGLAVEVAVPAAREAEGVGSSEGLGALEKELAPLKEGVLPVSEGVGRSPVALDVGDGGWGEAVFMPVGAGEVEGSSVSVARPVDCGEEDTISDRVGAAVLEGVGREVEETAEEAEEDGDMSEEREGRGDEDTEDVRLALRVAKGEREELLVSRSVGLTLPLPVLFPCNDAVGLRRGVGVPEAVAAGGERLGLPDTLPVPGAAVALGTGVLVGAMCVAVGCMAVTVGLPVAPEQAVADADAVGAPGVLVPRLPSCPPQLAVGLPLALVNPAMEGVTLPLAARTVPVGTAVGGEVGVTVGMEGMAVAVSEKVAVLADDPVASAVGVLGVDCVARALVLGASWVAEGMALALACGLGVKSRGEAVAGRVAEVLDEAVPEKEKREEAVVEGVGSWERVAPEEGEASLLTAALEETEGEAVLVTLARGERVSCGEPEGEVDTLVDCELLRVAPGLREAVPPLFKLPVIVLLLDALPLGEGEAVPVGESCVEAEGINPVAEGQALLDTLGRADTLAPREFTAEAEAMEGEVLGDAPGEADAPIPGEAVAGAVKGAVALPPPSPGPLLTVAARGVHVGCAVGVPCPAVGVAGREGMGD